MKFQEFVELIKKNSKNGTKTEFFKVTLSVDDYRKAVPSEFGMEETFLAGYNKDDRQFIIYYPEKNSELKVKAEKIEEEFYNHGWGNYFYK